MTTINLSVLPTLTLERAVKKQRITPPTLPIPPLQLNVERMQQALASDTYDMPKGLTREQQRQFILSKAKGS